MPVGEAVNLSINGEVLQKYSHSDLPIALYHLSSDWSVGLSINPFNSEPPCSEAQEGPCTIVSQSVLIGIIGLPWPTDQSF